MHIVEKYPKKSSRANLHIEMNSESEGDDRGENPTKNSENLISEICQIY